MKAYPLCLHFVANMFTRLLVGFPLCRDERSLDLLLSYTRNTSGTLIIMRFFPKFLHPIVAVFTPYAWLVRLNVWSFERLITPLILQRSKKQGDEDPSSNEKSEGVLQWMIDIARDNEENPRTLAQQALFLALAAIHTTTIVTTQVLFDLGARPEYIQPIRDEILQALEDEGKEVGKDGWQKSALDKMPKLDSFMKESPRLAPQTLCKSPRFHLHSTSLTPFPDPFPETFTRAFGTQRAPCNSSNPITSSLPQSCLLPGRPLAYNSLGWLPPPTRHPFHHTLGQSPTGPFHHTQPRSLRRFPLLQRQQPEHREAKPIYRNRQ